MVDSSSPSAAGDTAGSSSAVAPAVLKKGALVRLNLEAYQGSLEASASDAEVPDYVLEGPGEILMVKGDFAQIRWRRPVPDVWLRLNQLRPWQA